MKDPWEIIFVDDGSRDRSFETVKVLSQQDDRIRAISLSRNFGHQVALTAGMQHARGNMVITMDADLQHPPGVITVLLEHYRQGFEIVNTRRIDSTETGYFKKHSSRFFYRFINRISDISIAESSSDFRLMSRKALDAFLQFGERDRFTRGLVSWMGFRQALVDYECLPRFAGKSKYTLRKMIHFAADGITAFSAKPLRIASYMGVMVFLVGLAYAIFAIIQHASGKTIPGWTSLLVTVLLLGGIQPDKAPGTVMGSAPNSGTVSCPFPVSASRVIREPERPLALSPTRRRSRADQRIAKRSPPMPVMCGSTRLSTAAAVTAASTALPPRWSTAKPAAVASGWLVAITPLGA
jgi:dolichol-phosphate mannosyltransferase